MAADPKPPLLRHPAAEVRLLEQLLETLTRFSDSNEYRWELGSIVYRCVRYFKEIDYDMAEMMDGGPPQPTLIKFINTAIAERKALYWSETWDKFETAKQYVKDQILWKIFSQTLDDNTKGTIDGGMSPTVQYLMDLIIEKYTPAIIMPDSGRLSEMKFGSVVWGINEAASRGRTDFVVQFMDHMGAIDGYWQLVLSAARGGHMNLVGVILRHPNYKPEPEMNINTIIGAGLIQGNHINLLEGRDIDLVEAFRGALFYRPYGSTKVPLISKNTVEYLQDKCTAQGKFLNFVDVFQWRVTQGNLKEVRDMMDDIPPKWILRGLRLSIQFGHFPIFRRLLTKIEKSDYGTLIKDIYENERYDFLEIIAFETPVEKLCDPDILPTIIHLKLVDFMWLIVSRIKAEGKEALLRMIVGNLIMRGDPDFLRPL